MKKQNRIVLHVTVPSAAFFFVILDQAVAIAKANRASSVHIIMHPYTYPKSLNILRALLQNPTIVCAYISRRLKLAFLSSTRKQLKEKESIYLSLMRKKSLSMRICDVSIRAEVVRMRLPLAPNDLIAVVRELMRLRMIPCDDESLYNLKIDGVIIGDLIASTTLRMFYECGGRIRKCRGKIFVLLWGLVLMRYLRKHLNLSTYKNDYVLIQEPTYLHSIYKRWLRKRGAAVIELSSKQAERKVYGPTDKHLNPAFYDPRYATNKPIDYDSVSTYLNRRLENYNLLPYMRSISRSSRIEQLIDASGDQIKVSNLDNVVIVFLHSFDDGQFYFGLDGLGDAYNWATYTISKLLENKKLSKILIKSHPNVNHSRNPGDKEGVDNLMRLYGEQEKIVFLSKDVAVSSFADFINAVGITRYGSVAEELVYMNIPTISSSLAPWGEFFHFTYHWRGLSEYDSLLSNLSDLVKKGVTSAQMEDLYKYIFEYRLSFADPKIVIEKYFQLRGINYNTMDDTEVEQEFRAMRLGDNNFAFLLKIIKKDRCIDFA